MMWAPGRPRPAVAPVAVVPPVPPAPPVPPTPPVPPAPHLAHVPHAVPAGPALNRVIVIQSKRGDTEARSRIPVGLAGDTGRFISKQVRQHLEACELDLEQLLGHIAHAGIGHSLGEVELVHIEEGDDELMVRLE
jgi:hypothetical protein